MPSRHRRRRTAAVVGVAGAATLALCTAPGTYAAFSDFGTVGVHAEAAIWGDSTPDWLARCGDLSQYGEVVFADPISIFGVSFATVDGDNPGLDSGHPKIIDLPTRSGGEQIIVGASNAVNILYGGNGKDCLVGGDQTDVLAGGNGRDVLLGGGGADFLFGGEGDDTLYGGSGFDTMDGGSGKDDVYTEGPSQDLVIGLPSEIHTPDPTAGPNPLAIRSMGLATAASVGDIDTTTCSDSMDAALPDTPPTGAQVQDLIDTLNVTKAQCLADDAGTSRGSLSSTLSSGSPSSTTSSTPTDPKADPARPGDPAPSEDSEPVTSPTPTTTPTPTATQTSSAAAPTGQPSSDTSSATGTASVTTSGAATTPSGEGGQS